MITGGDTKDSDMSLEATFNSSEFNRLWAKTNRETQDMRALIDEILLNQGITLKAGQSRKEELLLDEKTSATRNYLVSEYEESGIYSFSERVIALVWANTKKIIRKYITN